MRFLPAKSSERALLAALLFFLLSRAFTLTAFPIFNDEAIYLQYSQAIRDDWQKYKFVSMHGAYGDWKPPLQYWMAAPFIRCGNDPLLAGRGLALAISLGGLFGFYFFAKELFGKREAILTAWLYGLCPPVLFHNNEFIAETFLFSTAPCFYAALLKAMRPNERRGLWFAAAIFSGAALLLFKQSGFLLLAVSIFLPFAEWPRRSESEPEARAWKKLAANFALTLAVVICAQLIFRVVIPPQFNHTRTIFDRNWVFSAHELATFPVRAWNANLLRVRDYVDAYYSWIAPLFCGAFLWLAIRKKSARDFALAAMCLTGAIVTCFFLRSFNEYLFNTAIIATLLPILARSAILLWDRARPRERNLVPRTMLALFAVMLTFWSYQIVLMRISPARYIERSTPWAIENYLEGWPTGFGIKEIVAFLAQENRHGIILADAQWGNPRTALEVYAKTRFPNLWVIPVLRDFSDPEQMSGLIERAKKEGLVRFAIFSADPVGGRAVWQSKVERDLCLDRTEIRADPKQMPIIVCRF